MMRPLIIAFIASTALMCSHVSGLYEQHRAAYERVTECIKNATTVDSPEDHPNVITLFCDGYQANYPCIIQPLDTDTNTEILDFYRAYVLQHAFFVNKKFNTCGEPLPYQELKELVDKSGIMAKENLPSVENDTYVPCAGKVTVNCFKAFQKLWEDHANDFRNFDAFISCYEKAIPSCDFPIVRHMNIIEQAFAKHMSEKAGLLGGMLEKIKP